MEKITFASADSQENEEFFVLEQTKLNGVSYILVTDSEEDDAECWILKDTSPEESSEAIYEFVEDEKELNGIMGVFEELLEDVLGAAACEVELGVGYAAGGGDVILTHLALVERLTEVVAEGFPHALHRTELLAEHIHGVAVGTELTSHQSRLRDCITDVTDARFRVNHALLALVLLIPGFVLTRNLVVLIHLLCPDALYSTTYALTRSLLADDDRHEGYRSLAAVAILRLHAVGVGCGNREGREEGRHASLWGYARE